jgi:L-fucose isomerase-like protein
VVRCSCSGSPHWYADIDDAGDRQPDDPFWYVDQCASQAAALDQACARLLGMDEALRQGMPLARVIESRLVAA